MLKRKDLVEQFSLVVKQEIKNHQDARLAMNLAINSLKEQIASLSAQFSSSFADLDSRLKMQDVRQDRLEKAFIEMREKHSASVRDLESAFRNIRVVQETLAHKVFECQNEGEELARKIEVAFALDTRQAEELDDLHKQIMVQVTRLDAKIIQQAATTKEEIINMPSELESIKSELENKIDAYRVDSNGRRLVL